MSGHRGKLAALAVKAAIGELFTECKQQSEVALAAGTAMSELFTECKQQSEVALIELQEILEEMHVYLIQQAAVKLDDIPIDIEQLKLDKEAKRSLLYKAREPVRLPGRPKINKMWIVKPTIRARLPIY